jgi:23S rRNA pseudouridine2605 synthase
MPPKKQSTNRATSSRATSSRTSQTRNSDKKYSDRKTTDRKSQFGKSSDSKPSDRKTAYGKSNESKYGEKKYGESKFSDKKFSDKKSNDKKSTFSKTSTDKAQYNDAPKRNYNRKPAVEIVNKNLKRDEDGSVRLNKFIADSGLCSRRKADEHILLGEVRVNGKVIKELGTKVKLSDNVSVNGDPVSYYTKNIYILLNKPKDAITTTSDELGRKTVMDIVKRRERIFPVGRLDRNTTGVLILTNDGELANRLTHPSYQIEKLYKATLDKKLNFEHAKKLSEGVELEDGKTAPCFIFIEPTDNTKITIVLKEGKYREIRRMFEHFGYIVKKLDRKEFAGLTNSGLKRGEYRFLTTNEINKLKKHVSMD